MRIELLYIEGCPGHEVVWAWIRNMQMEQGIPMEFKRIHVRTPAQAEELKFAGSPTVRIDGQDIVPTEETHYNVKCRLYEGKRGPTNHPPKRLLEEAILKASQ